MYPKVRVTNWCNPSKAPPTVKKMFTFCSSCGMIAKRYRFRPPTL